MVKYIKFSGIDVSTKTSLKRKSMIIKQKEDNWGFFKKQCYKLATRFLSGIGAIEVEEEYSSVDEVRPVVIEIDIEIAERVIRERIYSLSHRYNKKITHVLMGYDQAKLFMNIISAEPFTAQPLSFQMKSTITDRVSPEFLGMKVAILPWVDSIIPLSEDDL